MLEPSVLQTPFQVTVGGLSQERDATSLLLPFIASALSMSILLLRVFSRVWTKKRSRLQEQTAEENNRSLDDEDASKPPDPSEFIRAFNILRLLGTLLLLVLSLGALFESEDGQRSRKVLISMTYLYNSLLAICTILSPNKTISRHLNLVLLATFVVFAYRDLWPLATYTQEPMDADEGLILWVKLAILTIISVLMPLFVPRQYMPVDPKNPMEIPNPEQTASIYSMTVYSYLGPLIFEAYRVPHLSHERLPPLPDYDRAEYLTSKAFPFLDPLHGAKKRHLFFGILRVFSKDFLQLVVLITLLAISNYIPAIALNKVLAFLESRSAGQQPTDGIRPWFWVLCLFLGPLSVSLSLQRYAFVATTLVARTQAIMTQLIFEHSLRIRLVADSSGGAKEGDSESRAEVGKSQREKGNNLVGMINTLVAVDVGNLGGGKDFLMVVLQGPFELTIATAILWNLLGWSAIVGLASIILLLPLPGYIGRKMQKIHLNRMRKTDARIQSVVETLSVIRMIKMFGWEDKMKETLNEKREEELGWLWKDKMINLVNELINFIIPTITMLLTYATYTLIMKESLNASKVFASAAVFASVRGLMRRTSTLFGLAVKAKVSLDRISKFLLETELLDEFLSIQERGTKTSITAPLDEDGREAIGFKNAEFSWSKSAENEAQEGIPSSQSFRLRIPGEIRFKRGGINLIVGPTGAGKTSILMALLGEMHSIPSETNSWYHLPREGGIAYCAQEAWIQNDTIKNNILFGLPHDEERYNKVLYQCALLQDLKLFDARDESEVGERGLTLSGGQKARVSLARALYSEAEMLLLDDVFAALDVHTAKWIVKECFQGDLIRGRTVLLVTHNVALVSAMADLIISVNSDGVVRSILKETMTDGYDLIPEIKKAAEQGKLPDTVTNVLVEDQNPHERGKLMSKEEIALGRVSSKSYDLFLKGMGGDQYFLFLALWLFGIILMHGGSLLAVWFLGYWSSQYGDHGNKDVDAPFYLLVYSAILLATMVVYSLAVLFYNYGTQQASRRINNLLINSILQSTLQWLDRTPVSRIIARCSQDIASIDDRLPDNLSKVADMSLSMLVKFSAPIFFTPIFLLPGVLISMLGMYLCNVYLRAQMSMKRETSNARSPVLAHLGATLSGLVSVRAYKAQERFKYKSLVYIDHYTKVLRASNDLNRWIGIRIDLLGATFAGSLGWYLVSGTRLNAANTGLSLTMALEFCTIILWLLRYWNLLEIESNSLERILSYLNIDHEPEATQNGKPPAAWPSSGDLRVENLSARYSEGGPKVLRDISFQVKSGQRIGIVGRTGSGKSSLTLSLLRLILTEGLVFYDGLPTEKINLFDLRANISIIPQIPELLSGSLRRNLDPFGQHDDATLNNALHSAGFFTCHGQGQVARTRNPKSSLTWTLDSEISSAGGNISTGQRQIIALARAIVRRSHLLILDEATSAIDFETDSIIQSALKSQLGNDVTVLIVAHRLRTVMDADKIMVLDEGQIVEFDSPSVLLQRKSGYFKSLIDRSGDRTALYAMVANGATLL